MKLKFIKDYRSIKKFEDVELPDFTVLTGLNGSGKTHLLEAIGSDVALEIDGEISHDAVYFDYNDFIVKQPTNNNNKQYNPIKKTQTDASINASIKRIVDRLEELISRFSEGFSQEAGAGEEEVRFAQYLVDRCFRQRLNFLDPYNIEDLENEWNIGEQQKEEMYKNLLDAIKDIKKLKSFNRYYKISQQKSVHLTKLQAGHVKYTENFLGQLLENEFKDYRQKQTINDNNYKPAERGEEIEYLEEDAFIIKYGQAPWHFFNEILKEYGCNDYLINWKNLPRPQFPQTPEQFVVNLTVENKQGIKIPIDQLSSGEKTLLALAYQIYRSLKDGNLPEVLLLDEIDTCLHPSMTEQLLKVLKDVFVNKYGMKVILVTHAPSTVALAPNESVFTLQSSDDSTMIEKKTKEEALTLLTSGFVSLSKSESDLNISYNISKGKQNILLTEGITDKIIIETAWSKLFPEEEIPFSVQDCFDASFLRNMLQRGGDSQDGIFTKYSDKKIVALFDFDTEGYQAWNKLKDKFQGITEEDPLKGLTKKHPTHTAFIMLLPVPDNTILKPQIVNASGEHFKDQSHLTIELLMHGVNNLSNDFEKRIITGGGEIIEFVGDKRKFAEKCIECSQGDFKWFKPLFEKLNELYNAN